MPTLDSYRKEIDTLDNELLNLFSQRFRVVKEIGLLKKTNHIPIVDKKREEEKLLNLTTKGKDLGLDKSFVKTVWYAIFHYSRLAQK